MRRSSWYTFSLLIALIALNSEIPQCVARGGRGRGGGSFGGIFGGWRKYKKQQSSGNSRRTPNGSPVYYTASKPVSSGSNSGASYSSLSKQQSKQQASYPRQQMPSYGGYGGYTNYASYYGNGGPGAAHLPTGSTYYPNMATMPQGAIYYAQQPQRSGMGDFLFGTLTGHMLSNMMYGPRHHVIYQHHHGGQTAENNPKVIVVNNGEATTSTQFPTGMQHYWPTDVDTPLEPFNTSVTPAEAMQPGKEPIFKRVKFNNYSTTQMTQAAQQQQQLEQVASTSPVPPANGIICMPILLNETDPNDPTKTLQVQRTICFPAPPPPSEALIKPAIAKCVIRTFIESDPNDPSKTIEVPKEICPSTTTTLEPPQVAGEIEEVERVTKAIEKVNEKVAQKQEEEELAESIETTTEGKFIRSLTTKSAV